jgi:hypothetical protein
LQFPNTIRLLADGERWQENFARHGVSLWVEALNFLDFWLPFNQVKGRRKIK